MSNFNLTGIDWKIKYCTLSGCAEAPESLWRIRATFRLRCGRAGSWKSPSASACDQAPDEKSHAMVRLVGRVIGVGIETADMLVREVLSRNLRDRRAAARYAGLTGAPDESGSKRRDKGLARAGDARVRRGMIQLAWRFLMFQKERALAQWPPRDRASGCAKAASCRAEVRPRLRRRNALASAKDAGLGLASLAHARVRPGTLGAQQYDLRQTRFCGALRSLTRARSRGDGNGNAGSHAADSHAARRPGIPSGFKYQTRSTSPCPFPWR
jgi:hypothetical protein